jgi:hypothetical protein
VEVKKTYILVREYFSFSVIIFSEKDEFLKKQASIEDSRKIKSILFLKNLKLDYFELAFIDEKLYNIISPYLTKTYRRNKIYKKLEDCKTNFDFREEKNG